MEKSIKKSLLVLLTCLLIVCYFNDALAQKGFQIGFSISPIYFHNKVEDFDSFNKNQVNLAYGLKIVYQINKNISLEFNPNYFQRYLSSNCVDVTTPLSTDSFGPYFFISKEKCPFTAKNTYYFLDLPLLLKYKLSTRLKSKQQVYIVFGNSMLYKLGRKDLITDASTGQSLEIDGYASDLYSFFSPIVGGEYEKIITKRLNFYSVIYLKTENPIFTNYSLGLNIGLKMRL